MLLSSLRRSELGILIGSATRDARTSEAGLWAPCRCDDAPSTAIAREGQLAVLYSNRVITAAKHEVERRHESLALGPAERDIAVTAIDDRAHGRHSMAAAWIGAECSERVYPGCEW